VLDAMQRRLDRMPKAMTIRRRTAEHPFGTIKAWMGAAHFLTGTLPKVKTEMSLQVLACNLKRMMALLGERGAQSLSALFHSLGPVAPSTIAASFNIASGCERKNPAALIEAYRRAARGKSSWCLRMLAYGAKHYSTALHRAEGSGLAPSCARSAAQV
jgi:hypothetical protein